MQIILLIILLGMTGWYFTTGIRIGFVMGGNAQLFNANGRAEYSIRTSETFQKVGVGGICTAKKGLATLNFYDPNGMKLRTQTCKPGKWALNMTSGGLIGHYKVVIVYKNFTGTLNITELRQ